MFAELLEPALLAVRASTAARRRLAAVKNLTSELVGRFCQAAQEATLAAGTGAGGRPLRRYDADLVVPRRQLLECALLKAVAAHYVMSREGAAARRPASGS